MSSSLAAILIASVPLIGAVLALRYDHSERPSPIRAVGLQIADAILSHKRISKQEAADEALKLLRAVQIRDPEQRMSAYPHELSGGMCQRVMIAIAISCATFSLLPPTTSKTSATN